MLERLKAVARQRPWIPDHGRLLLRHDRNFQGGFSDFEHMRAAARWLCAAQDAQGDGGIAGRYRLDRGWTSSCPEATGYLIPTLLALDKAQPGSGFAARAARAIDFLLRVQLDSGAFAGNSMQPSPFNTGLILGGLTAWHKFNGDDRTLLAARRAAAWLIAAQDADGAFRKHAYLGLDTTYTAYLTCWLAEWGAYAKDPASLAAAGRHLDWVLSHARANGWVERMGCCENHQKQDQAFTHTIACTYAGILGTSEVLGRADGIALAERAAEALRRLLELRQKLPGIVSSFRAKSDSQCLTGNAQTALIWFRLHRRAANLRFVNAGLKAIDAIKQTQIMTGRNAGIAGGIAGSDPIGGPYLPNAFPSLAAKFFIDALIEKQAIMRELNRPRFETPAEPAAIELKPAPAADVPVPHVVFLTRTGSPRVLAMMNFLRTARLGRVTVVAERRIQPPALKRIEQRLKSDGLRWLATAVNGTEAAAPVPDLAVFCRARGFAYVETGPLDAPEAVAAMRALAPDLGILADGPILKKPLLACFRLGVLNGHMGLVPMCRGMNAAEWAALEGEAAGCSVHLIDEGINTGPLLARRGVDVSDCRSVGALRTIADEAQLALLAEAVRATLASGMLPEVQTPPEPVRPQYFRMHRELAGVLQRRLEAQVLR